MSTLNSLSVVALMTLVVSWSAPVGAQQTPEVSEPDSPLSEQKLQELFDLVGKSGFYGLRDAEEAAAVAMLRRHPEQAAPKLAKMLATGHEHRKGGWIEVYRPLYIMQGMPSAIRLSLPDVIKALNDEHPVNVNRATVLLAELGPEAKAAVPALLEAWQKAKDRPRRGKEPIAAALKAIDPDAAREAHVE
jgi:hypothetical protein